MSKEKPETNIAALIDKTKAKNFARNRSILKSVAEAILFCARQCIALQLNVCKQCMSAKETFHPFQPVHNINPSLEK